MQPTMKVDRSEIAPERNGDAANPQPLRRAGLYRHPNGTEAIVQNDPLFGDAQAAAFEKVGFVFERDVEPGEIKTIATPSDSHATAPERGVENQAEELKGLRARLNQLEQAEASRAEAATPTPGASNEADVSGERAKESGTDKVQSTEGVKVDPSTGAPLESGKPGPEAVSKDDSRTKLEEVAKAEGLTDLDQYETKAKLVEAIEANRAKTDGKEGGNQ